MAKDLVEFPDIGEGQGFSAVGSAGPLNPFDSKYYQRFSVRNPQISTFARSYQVVLGLRKDPGVDFTDPQEAINKVSDQGGGTILVTPGVYPITETVQLKRDVSIEGISPQQCIFDYTQMVEYTGEFLTTGGGLIGEGNLRENSGLGTIAITNGSTTVTGTSTTFTTARAGDSLIVAGVPYKIDSIASDTSLTLETAYRGKTITGADYAVYDPIENISVSKITVRNGIGAGLGFFYAQNISIEDVHSVGWRLSSASVGYGIYPSDVYELFMKNVRVSDNESHGLFSIINRAQYLTFITAVNNKSNGIHLEGTDDSLISHVITTNNGDNGIVINAGDRNRIEILRAEANVNEGIKLVGDSASSVAASCSDNMVVNCIAKANGGNGIEVFDEVSTMAFGQDADIVTRNSIVANALIDNGAYGINVNYNTAGGSANTGLTDNSIRGGNAFSGNTSGKVNDTGSKTKIASRYVALDPPVQVLSTDPADTNWTDLDLTANSSADTYAATLSVGVNSTTAGRAAYLRTNGSSAGQTVATIVVHNPVASQTHYHPYTVKTDSDQIVEWSVNNADVSVLSITLLGYYEYIY